MVLQAAGLGLSTWLGTGKMKYAMEKEFSFRTAMIANADGADVSLQNTDHSTRCIADTEVLFRSLTEKLIEQINSVDAVFGCVAWLTSIPVLDAFRKEGRRNCRPEGRFPST